MNTATSTPATVDPSKDLNKASLHRSKTWDNHNSCSVLRFNESLGALNAADALDASDHNAAKPATAAVGQNRRSMLVRHSSVSALQQQQPAHLKLDNFMSSTPSQRPKARRQNSFSIFQSKSSHNSTNVPPPVELTRTSSTDILDKTIEISEKKPRRKTRKSHLSASMHEPRRNSGSSSGSDTKNERVPKEKRRSSSKSKNGPGALDRHLSNHSKRGSDHSRRSSGRKPGMPTIETDEMSCSSQSFFSKASVVSKQSAMSKASAISKCPSTRSAQRGLLTARSISGGASLLGGMGNSSRQLGRRSSNGMMDDSSQFVTGSRIRRGASCRQLLLA